jgi:hypothetical protein
MNAPIVTAARDGRSFVVRCPYCRKVHTHGAIEGHRVAHCEERRPDCPGYVLREDATPGALKRVLAPVARKKKD